MVLVFAFGEEAPGCYELKVVVGIHFYVVRFSVRDQKRKTGQRFMQRKSGEYKNKYLFTDWYSHWSSAVALDAEAKEEKV